MYYLQVCYLIEIFWDFFLVLFLLMISSLIPLWTESTLYDFYSFAFVEQYFMAQNMVFLGKCSMWPCCCYKLLNFCYEFFSCKIPIWFFFLITSNFFVCFFLLRSFLFSFVLRVFVLTSWNFVIIASLKSSFSLFEILNPAFIHFTEDSYRCFIFQLNWVVGIGRERMACGMGEMRWSVLLNFVENSSPQFLFFFFAFSILY